MWNELGMLALVSEYLSCITVPIYIYLGSVNGPCIAVKWTCYVWGLFCCCPSGYLRLPSTWNCLDLLLDAWCCCFIWDFHQSYWWEGKGEACPSVWHIRYDKLKLDTGTGMKRSKAWSVVLLHRITLARDSIRRRCTGVWPTELNLCLTQRHRVVLYRVMFACVCFPNDSVDSFRRRGTNEKPMEAYFSIRQSHVHAFIAQAVHFIS